MASFDVSHLNRIVKETLNMIDKSRDAIFDIAEGARRECNRLEEELNELKLEAKVIIEQSDLLEVELKKSRMRLAAISKSFDRYTQDDIRIAYESADKVRVELAINREREKFAILRRNDLERRIKEAFVTVSKAESLVSQVGTIMDYLSGDLSNLNDHLDDSEKRKYLAIRVIKAQEEERSRVAREIHDGPAQSMSNVVLKAEICEKLIDINIDQARSELQNLKKIVRESLKDVRRIIYDLRPMSLEDLGLLPTLQKYVESFSLETGIDIIFHRRGLDMVVDDKNLNLTIFRVVQEALNNIRKHSKAKTGEVRVEFTPLSVSLKISDNGQGFDANALQVAKDDHSSGFGLMSMKERIELMLGKMEISSQPGKGTVVKVVLPHSEE
ncbi:MAG: sensor histidine kinase [Ruminiclostridium sp.]|nr:sensor histidine kinase [Ruminiclostridium sp.]